MFGPASRSPRVIIGAFIVVAIGLAALLAPELAPHDPAEQDILNALVPPMWAEGGMTKFPFGTDSLGRCILSQMIYGARVALIVGVLAATFAMFIGSTLALVAGHFGGLAERGIRY